MSIVKLENAGYVYGSSHPDNLGTRALDSISLEIEKGEFVVMVGRNGSGKSTFARLLNALLTPTSGTVLINGIDTRIEKSLWDIRSNVGMIFQNPDNQIIGTIVEEDVAFGPENLGIDPKEIRIRVDEALDSVGISEYAKSEPHQLSGGQKQKVAIAGILAMKPHCIVLDEATAMLDPVGRRETMGILKRLNKEEGITVIHITHNMDEAKDADRVIVIDKGNIAADGKPEKVFSNVRMIKELGLDVPQVTELLFEIDKIGYKLALEVLDVDKAYSELSELLINREAHK
ncbi:MAG: energy-coupling factor transporter ATPase [Clostridia bacterium]|jgi:energy-coupling factor transport system ATP-binding protein